MVIKNYHKFEMSYTFKYLGDEIFTFQQNIPKDLSCYDFSNTKKVVLKYSAKHSTDLILQNINFPQINEDCLFEINVTGLCFSIKICNSNADIVSCYFTEATIITIENCPNLKYFQGQINRCSNRRFKNLNIISCPNLEYLDLYHNPLHNFNFSSQDFPNLKYLDCSSNLLKEIELDFPKLEILKLGNNFLTFLDIRALKNLKKLDLKECEQVDVLTTKDAFVKISGKYRLIY